MNPARDERCLRLGPCEVRFTTHFGSDARTAEAEFLADFSVRAGHVTFLRQVHSANVLAEESLPVEGGEGDGLVAGPSGTWLGIRTADCIPLALVCTRTGARAAVHCGWRGTLAGIVPATLAALGRRGAVPGDMLAFVGPANRSCCYEVGDEVGLRFAARWGAEVYQGRRDGKGFLDVAACVRSDLTKQGLAASSIHDSGLCTHCPDSGFHSYRREGPGGGRMLTMVSPANNAA